VKLEITNTIANKIKSSVNKGLHKIQNTQALAPIHFFAHLFRVEKRKPLKTYR